MDPLALMLIKEALRKKGAIKYAQVINELIARQHAGEVQSDLRAEMEDDVKPWETTRHVEPQAKALRCATRKFISPVTITRDGRTFVVQP